LNQGFAARTATPRGGTLSLSGRWRGQGRGWGCRPVARIPRPETAHL